MNDRMNVFIFFFIKNVKDFDFYALDVNVNELHFQVNFSNIGCQAQDPTNIKM